MKRLPFDFLRAAQIPERATVDGLEAKWVERWESAGTYRFDQGGPKEGIYSIDTPPPTASGSLHVGHVFSYTHTDIVARYQRMQGKNVFYPMGWDDNGLPTERRVQNYFGVRCDPSLPYQPAFEPPQHGGDNKSSKASDQLPISRRNFVELCEELTAADEVAFERLWRNLGLSVDWLQSYRTISDQARRTSQRAFLANLQRGEAYLAQAPTLWDVTFRTAVAQAELEDREQPGAYHTLLFSGPNGDIAVDSTRPELVPACVALIAHPDDERYQDLFYKTASTPLFEVAVPILPHPLAQPDKGTGIAMCCTFGDVTDVIWWRELKLETRPVIGFDGRFVSSPPAGIVGAAGEAAYAPLAGKTVFSAREEIVRQLNESGKLIGDPRPIQHPVKFFEKGDRPLEIVSTRQWYIKNGGTDSNLAQQLIDRGSDISFHPGFMQVRLNDWINGLNSDWLISRQRFFGVPIPIWYRINEAGEIDYDSVLLPSDEQLPVDPSSDVPNGFQENQRGKPGGFAGDLDVMDTWATSSLTPQLAGGWIDNPQLFEKVFPYDLRPQGQDIIRTWLFSTLLRSHLEHDTIPWKHAAISGWILDPDRKKMSKSKGNVVVPNELLEEHGSDGVRYWAASARLGTDAAFDVGQMKVGRRLANKVLNAARFVLSFELERAATPSEPIDLAMLAKLRETVSSASEALAGYDHTKALEVTESFFWQFTDDYLELVKDRAYGNQGGEAAGSAIAALRIALGAILRLLAPYLPYATEEAWSWWQQGSVHIAEWPKSEEFASNGDSGLLELASGVLTLVRKTKSDAKASMKTQLNRLMLSLPESALPSLQSFAADLKSAGSILNLELTSGETLAVAKFQIAEADESSAQ